MTGQKSPNGLELRAGVELRASGRKLAGVAVPFGTPAPVGGFVESFLPGSFAVTLRDGHDILALLDHRSDRLLARSANGSLRLREAPQGLEFELDVPPTTLGADCLAMCEAGLLGGVSVGFRLGKDAWPAPNRRIIEAAVLVELSLIQSFPAYAATSVTARNSQPSAASARRRFLDAL